MKTQGTNCIRKMLCLIPLTICLLIMSGMPVPAESALTELLRAKLKELEENPRAQELEAAKLALVLAEKTLGPDHPTVALRANNLGFLYFSQGRFGEAEPLYRRALSIWEKAYGPDHQKVAPALSNLALLDASQGHYDKAEPLYQRAIGILEKSLGPDDPELAQILNNLAQFYCEQGRLAAAEPLCQRAVAIKEKALGPDHPEVASGLNNLGCIFFEQGRYPAAETALRKALEIVEKPLAASHPVRPSVLNSLAVLQSACGRFAEAEAFYRRASEEAQRIYGPDHPATAKQLGNLAMFYDERGQTDRASPLLFRALASQEKSLGADHPDIALSLNNLGMRYAKLGDHSKAEPFLRRALAIFEKVWGPDHAHVATCLNNLGAGCAQLKRYEEADSCYWRSLGITSRTLGQEHPDYASTLNNLATLESLQGDHAKAEETLRRSLAIKEKALGNDHPGLLPTLSNLASACGSQGRHREAFELCLRKHGIENNAITEVFSFSSEHGRFQFLTTLESDRNQFLSLCVGHMAKEGDTAMLDYLLRRKAVVLDSLLEDAAASRLAADPAQAERLTQLRETKTRLAAWAYAGHGAAAPSSHQAAGAKLQEQAELLEQELARQSAGFRALRASRRVGLNEVAAALPPASALVEFACFFQSHSSATAKSRIYVACVLRHGENAATLVRLGDADTIDGLIRDYRRSIRGFIRKEATVAGVNAASASLAEAAWNPVRSALGSARRVFLSPDGELNFVSFAGLCDRKGRFLVEDYDLSYVASGRDLVREAPPAPQVPLTAVLIGAPDFAGNRIEPAGEMITRGVEITPEPLSARAFPGLRFDPLPGTSEEIREIGTLAIAKGLQPETYQGLEASEGRIKAVKHPAILHLATHGFFLPADPSPPPPTGLLFQNPAGQSLGGDYPYPQSPMHRSGLAFAGANLALAGHSRLGENDGILTAGEVAGLDLVGTGLVVLSACDTGLGETMNGEGVMGLRRAFVQAGAGSLVASLWQVPDVATHQLMGGFYRKHLDGQSVCQALLAAQREAITHSRKSGAEPNPVLWAGFVASGIGNR